MKKPKIAAAAGTAAGTGKPEGSRLSARMDEAMAAAVLECAEKGVTDDTPPERVVKLLGRKFAGKDGSTVIREAKLAARLAVKKEAAAAAANAAD